MHESQYHFDFYPTIALSIPILMYEEKFGPISVCKLPPSSNAVSQL